MDKSETCVLSFRTSSGKTKNVSIKDPRSDLSTSAVNSLGNQLLSTPLFDDKTGTFTAFLGAEVATVEKTKIV